MGYLPDAFHEHFARRVGPRHASATCALRYAVEDEPLGTAGAIRFAAEGIDERFVVCNGDVLTDLDLGAMVRFHDERGAEATIALTQVDDPSAFGVVPTARRRRGDRVRREAARRARRRATGSTRARTCSSRRSSTASRRGSTCRSSARRSRACSQQPGRLFGYQRRRVLARHRDAREVPRRRTPTCSRGRLGLPPAPGAREVAPGVWVQGDVDDRARRDVVERRCCSATGARVERGRARARARCSARGVGRRGRRRCSTARCCTTAPASSHGSTRAPTRWSAPDAVLEARRRRSRRETIVGAGVTDRGRHPDLAAGASRPSRPSASSVRRR